MATYLILNLVFLGVVLGVLYLRRALVWNRTTKITLLILLVTTAIFDSLIIIAGIVDYNYQLLLGVSIGAAPIEDFFYAILAVIMVPSLWHWLGKETINEANR